MDFKYTAPVDAADADEPKGLFGKRLERLMKERGMSQYELARRMGYDRSQIVWRFIHGKNEPSYIVLRRLKAALGCEYKDLFED